MNASSFHTPEANWTVQAVGMNRTVLDRMEHAVAKVRDRLLRVTAALNQAGIPYAVVGGNAVASWVATVDEGAVRQSLRGARKRDWSCRRIATPGRLSGLAPMV